MFRALHCVHILHYHVYWGKARLSLSRRRTGISEHGDTAARLQSEAGAGYCQFMFQTLHATSQNGSSLKSVAATAGRECNIHDARGRRLYFTNHATCPWLSLFCPWLSLVCPWLSRVCLCLFQDVTDSSCLMFNQQNINSYNLIS